MTPPSDQDEHPSRHRPWSGRPVSVSSTASRLRLALPADWIAPSIARDRLDHWLRELVWPTGQREDLVLAVSEAVSNSVEHGYGVSARGASPDGPSVEVPSVDVHADLVPAADGTRRIVLSIRDSGGWREPTATPHRGHGIRMIRAGGDIVVIEGSAQGTTVTLTSRPAPPARHRPTS